MTKDIKDYDDLQGFEIELWFQWNIALRSLTIDEGISHA